MESFPWWNEKQRKLMKDVKSFADDNLPRGEEISWTREYPMDLVKEVAERGWFGALIPKDYGGIDAGVTGCCIAEPSA